MNRVLARPAVGDAPRALTSPTPALDAYAAELLARAEQAAYERGVRDGVAQARAEADEAGRRVAAAVAEGRERVVAELAALRARQAADAVAVAAAIARAVLDREPGPDSGVLLARVREALAAVDDADVTVAVSAADAEAFGDRLAGASVAADPSLGPGEARLEGRWARADLTREAAVEAVCAAMDAGGAGDA